MRHLLVDGYNLLYVLEKEGFLPQIRSSSLEERRERFLQALQKYQSKKKIEVTVALDSNETSGIYHRRLQYGAMKVVFTSESQSADDYIAEACEKNPSGYVVVSNDREVIRSAERYHCVSMKSDELAIRLQEASFEENISEDVDIESLEEDSKPLYPKISTRKKGSPRKASKQERRRKKVLKKF